MKYIGIRGHRGAGKNTVTYLLANTIEYLTQKGDMSFFEEVFNEWCGNFRNCEDLINALSLNYVIVEGFGDGPKMLLSMLTGIDLELMNDDYSKDHTVINLRDFSIGDYDYPKSYFGADLVTAKDFFIEQRDKQSFEPGKIEHDVYMTLREAILYFGIYVMQNAFGRNVWVKSLVANERFYNGLFPEDSNNYKIFNDIKARSEISYILNKGGVIIKVSRPGHRKSGGMDLLRGDNRYTYEVVIGDKLEDLREPILEIAQQIISA